MELNKDLKEFLITYQDRLIDKSFLIDILTIQERSKGILVDHDELSKSSMSIPYIRNHVPFETPVIEEPDNDIEKWISENKLEIIRKVPSFIDLVNIYRNFNVMTQEEQDKSNEQAKEFYGVDNHQKFKELLSSFVVKLGDVFCLSDRKTSYLAYLTQIADTGLEFIYLTNDLDKRLMSETDTFTLLSGDISNCKEKCETTVGKFLLNKVVLEYIFKDMFPYINTDVDWKPNKVCNLVAEQVSLDKVTIPQLKKFLDHVYYLGHFTEISVPTLTKKSFVTTPAMAKRKAELLKQYKDQLSDPVVLKKIEDELILLDKDYLKGDDVLRYYNGLDPDKVFGVQRKKMYITGGAIADFKKGSNDYIFVPNSLSEGWTKESFPILCNELRAGSYSRGHETQLGGAQSKFLVRVFQDLEINMDDCESDKGIEVDFSIFEIKNFIGRYVMSKSGLVEITKENMNQYKDKIVTIRSPMYCKNSKGLCYTCVGKIYKNLDQKLANMLAIEISSTFLTLALKKMHGSALKIFDVDDISKFIITKE